MPLPLAAAAAMMIPGLIPGLGKSIAGIGEGIGSAAKGIGGNIGSALGGAAGGPLGGLMGGGVGSMAEKGLGAVGDFLFGDDEEDEKNYDTMTIDNLEIDTLEIDTANIDKLIIDSKDLGKTDDKETDTEKLDTEQKENTTEDLFSGISENIDEPSTAEQTSDGIMQALPEEEEVLVDGAVPQYVDKENNLNQISESLGESDQKGTNNSEDGLVPNIDTMTETSGQTTKILAGGESIGGSFGDLTMDASDMSSELGDISETLATPDEGPGFNWEDLKDSLAGGGGGGGAWDGVKDVVGGAWDGVKDVVGGLWEGAGDLLGFDTASDVEAKSESESMAAMAAMAAMTSGGIGDKGIGIMESIRDNTHGILNSLTGDGLQTTSNDGLGADVRHEYMDDSKKWMGGDGLQTTSNDGSDFTKESEIIDSENIINNSETTIVDTVVKQMNEFLAESAGGEKKSTRKNQQSDSRGGSPNQPRPHKTSETNSRGMNPAYTKQPPGKPTRTSRTIIEEIRSYHQYPPWMWKLG